ncbi:hypothetical protein [Campylobacter concisus]|uniref:hypothetical protein n=1 Tax=Campylobacter concisus TaxID=199 RepID=UPI00122C8B66|nr:hypothetical protein [Campylobacter concisus]
MTEEKILYLIKKLEKNIKKEIFSIFDYMFCDCKDDRNYEYEVVYELIYDEKKQKCSPCFYVYYGDYRKSNEYKFNDNDRSTAKYKHDDEAIQTSCYFEAANRNDDYLDSSRISAYTLARLMHFSKKYDKKIKKQETTNEPTTN